MQAQQLQQPQPVAEKPLSLMEFLQLAGEIPINTTVETAPLAEANEVLGRLKASEIRGATGLVPSS
jgi:D-arabinose 1-dehydrogenase-like Zn-dependent alcohol dehydrogenase